MVRQETNRERRGREGRGEREEREKAGEGKEREQLRQDLKFKKMQAGSQILKE